jgi:predicted nucleotidyltransferase
LGLVRWERQGRQKYFTVNVEHPLYPELRGLVLKTDGLAEPLREALSGLAGIEAAAVFGSMAAGTAGAGSDVDLFVIGEADDLELHRAMSEAESLLGRQVNYVLMTRRELQRRLRSKEPFLARVLSGALIPVLGDIHAL